jgi:predicted ATPase/DNA-binding CsgD family transcriptional regulator
MTEALPAPPTRLVGRADEVRRLRALLLDPGARLATLTGPGGVGKTRLALAAAAELEAAFAHGAAFVDLSPLTNPALVPTAVAAALGIREVDDELLVARLFDALRGRALLLVLDNFEHVAAAAPFVAQLLSASPLLTALVTSREPLRLSAERIVAVPPLSLPSPDDTAAAIAENEAVRLFLARAQAERADFALTPANAQQVAEIVRRLDGLPLAIELAAARIAHLTPGMLLSRLEQRLPMLTGGPRDAPARQRTLASAIAWSYDLLAPELQALFRRLAVFVGGFTLDAAAAVAGADGDDLDVLDNIAGLSAQSLVRPLNEVDGELRFGMLETIREFAVDALARSGESAPAERHAAYFLRLAERAERAFSGEEPGDWQATIEAERGNLRAALVWATTSGETETALRLSGLLFDALWLTGSPAREQQRQARAALALPGGSPAARAKTMTAVAWITLVHGDPAEARRLARSALAHVQAVGDARASADALYVLGVTAFVENEIAEARVYLADAIVALRALNARGRLGWALCYAASVESRNAIDEGGDASVLEQASRACEEALRLFQNIGQRRGVVRALHGLAYIAFKRRDLPKALATTQQILALDWAEHRPIYHYLEDIADIAGRLGQPELAARLYGAADEQRARYGIPLEGVYRAEYDRDLAIARDALGAQAFAAAWSAGHVEPLGQVVQEALRLETPGAAPEPDQAAPQAERPLLSRREQEILPLLAAGLSDPEIARALFLSTRTVEHHVARTAAKFGVRGRSATVEAARAAGLISAQSEGK